MEDPPYGLLLEDVMGYKKDTSGQFHTELIISKGSFLQPFVTHNKPLADTIYTYSHHNNNILTDLSATLCCYPAHWQVHQLTTVQKHLLSGIQSLPNRIKEIHNLSWVESLKIGFAVCVFLPSTNNPQKATVQYIGEVTGEIGRRFGLKLKVCKKFMY